MSAETEKRFREEEPGFKPPEQAEGVETEPGLEAEQETIPETGGEQAQTEQAALETAPDASAEEEGVETISKLTGIKPDKDRAMIEKAGEKGSLDGAAELRALEDALERQMNPEEEQN